MLKYIVALSLTATAAWAYTDEQDKVINQIKGAFWAAQNCKGLEINKTELLVRLTEAHLDAKALEDISKGLDPDIAKVFREMGKDTCQLLWYQYGSNNSTPTRGSMLFMSK
jgi:hypothetical protein